MRKQISLLLLLVLIFSCIFCFSPNKTVLADNTGKVNRSNNGKFQAVTFTVSSNAHSTGTVYRTTGLKITIGNYYAFFDQAYLQAKGFYSSSTTDTVDFTAADIAKYSGASMEQVCAAANSYVIYLGAQIQVLQNGVVKATIEEKNQVPAVFNAYGLGAYIATAQTRWGSAYDPQKPPVPPAFTLTMQIQGQGSTSPVGSPAPGTVHNNMSGTVPISATPIAGWKFGYWFDVDTASSLSAPASTTITMDRNRTMRAVFLPDGSAEVKPTSEVPPTPEPPLPPAPPNFNPIADFNIDNPNTIEGQTVHFTDHSKHPGAAYGESIVSWEWDIEDQPDGSGKTVTATWDQAGTYDVRLKVKDQDGDYDTCTKSVVVGPAIPAAVITINPTNIILGRKITIDGDQSTAALDREIQWDKMQWEFTKPDGSQVNFTGRYPISDRAAADNLINQIGNWKVRLKVMDTKNYESEWTESYFSVFPDNPPIADFWISSESLRHSYQSTTLAITDLSTPGTPDGSLGDKITSRQWTLYYDGNNDDIFDGAEDEVIKAGSSGEAAQLIVASENDTKPVIKFTKTGHFKLELVITESHLDDWTGNMVTGLSADTLKKAEDDKKVTVINIAPTVNFSIKKKVPVDIQFVTDYTVSDQKAGNLISSQPGFINTLIGSYIQPTINNSRVKKGDIGLLMEKSDPYERPYWTYEGPYYRNMKPTIDPEWRNIEYMQQNIFNNEYDVKNEHININSGEIVDGFLPVPPAKNTYEYSASVRTPELNGLSCNNKYSIKAQRGLLQVFNKTNSNLVSSVVVPKSNAKAVVGSKYLESDGPLLIAPWGDNQTIVVYQNFIYTAIYHDNKEPDYRYWSYEVKDYLYLYLIDNQSGSISDRKEFIGLYVDSVETGSNHLGIYNISVYKLGKELLGIHSTTTHLFHDDDRCNTIGTIIDSNFKQVKVGTGYDWEKDIDLQPINDNQFLAVEVLDYDSTEPRDSNFRIWSRNSWGNWSAIRNLGRYSWGYEWRDTNNCFLEYTPFFSTYSDGSYINSYHHYANDDNQEYGTEYYDKEGNLKWKITGDIHAERYSIGPHNRFSFWRYYTLGTAKMFMGYIVLTDTFSGKGSTTYLVNPETGEIVYTLPYKWLGNDESFLLLQQGDGTSTVLKGYGQKGGLSYLVEVANQKAWDPNRINVIVSVTDSDKYGDYEGNKQNVQSLLGTSSIHLAVIAPNSNEIKTQTEELTKGEDGWWIQTNTDMSKPLDELAQKIIELVNKEKGADNVVLINQLVELKSEYKDSENDPLAEMNWQFTHDPNNLGQQYVTSNPMGLSALHGATLKVPPTSFDKAGTYKIKCKAKDRPVTNDSYLDDIKAGAKWSSDAAELTIIAHRKPIAAFTLSSKVVTMKSGFTVTDQSYDPDLINTDPESKKGLRNWEWQYRNTTTNGNWISSAVAPTTFKSKGSFAIRLKVQDAHGAWSDWSPQQLFQVVNCKPIAAFDAMPNPVNVNAPCSLVDHSYDPDGDPLIDWEWNIKGQAIETQNKVSSNPFTVSWAVEGAYLVTLRVKDSEGAWSDPVSQIVTVINNNRPVAVLNLPAVGYSDEVFTGDGTKSYDPDPGDTVDIAYWQYKKPGGDWSSVITQYRGGSGYLYFNQTPIDTELGVWTVRLVVVDNHGLESFPVEKTIEIKEGFEVAGYVIPNPGERGRKMIVVAYAHRKASLDDKIQISSMTAYIVHPTKPDGSAALPFGQSPQVVNMVFDPATTTYRYTFLVPEKVQAGRWPDDGNYYIRAVGLKNTTQKECLIPASIKGHILQRVYTKTRSW